MNRVHLLLLSTLLAACADGGGDDTEDTTSGDGGSFHAVIEGEPWDADTDKVVGVIGDFGTGQVVSINAVKLETNEFFLVQLDVFEGEFATNDFTDVIVRWNGTDDVYQLETGSLTMTHSVDGTTETWTGEFSGTFPNVVDTASVEITDGEFLVHRLL